MAFWEQFPYTNFHDLNLDWVMKEIKSNTSHINTTNVNFEKLSEDVHKTIEELDTKVDNLNVPAAVSNIISNMIEDGSLQVLFPNNFINVKMFGAVGDGVTDDSEAIQNAIDNSNGLTLLFPDGVYLISRPINVWRHLEGSVILNGGATIKAGLAIPYMIQLGAKLDNIVGDNDHSQTIYGGGLIDCNGLAEIGVYIPSDCGYKRLSGIQIRNVKTYGVVVGEDGVSSSNQCYFDNIGIYGNYGDQSTTAMRLYGTDNIVTNCHLYLCGIGLEHFADVVDNVHVWTRLSDFDPASVGTITGIKTHGALYGGTIYVDSVGCGVYLDDNAKFFANALVYMTDHEMDNGVMINANYNSRVKLGCWYLKENRFTHVNPLKLRSQPNAANFSGIGNFYGVPCYDYLPANFEVTTELNNMCSNPIPSGLTRNYSTITNERYTLLGYVRVTTSSVTINLELNNVGGWTFTIRTLSNGNCTLGGITKNWGGANGSVFVGAQKNVDGVNYFPVYYKPENAVNYCYITMSARNSGLNGFFPAGATAPDRMTLVDAIDSILEIPLE